MFNATFNNISVISWRLVLLVENLYFVIQTSLNVLTYSVVFINILCHCKLWKSCVCGIRKYCLRL